MEKKELSPNRLKKMLAISLTAIAMGFIFSSCSSPYAKKEIVNNNSATSVQTTANGQYNGAPFTISRDINGLMAQISETGVTKNVCQADGSFVEDGSVDVRKAICDEYDSIARKIGVPEADIPYYVLYMAAHTVAVEPDQISATCDSPNNSVATCYQSSVDKIFIPANYVKPLNHESDHLVLNRIPDGNFYDMTKNICYQKKNGIFVVYYYDNNTNTFSKHAFSDEFFPALNDIAFTDTSNYLYQAPESLTDLMTAYANIIISNPEANLQYKIITKTATFSHSSPTLSDFAEIIRALTIVGGLERLTVLDSAFQSFTGFEIFQDPSLQSSPEQACSQS